MGTKRTIVIVVVALLGIYLLIGVPVCLRTLWRAPPHSAAEAYLNALKARDTTGIYLYSDMLGPHLAGMMAKSNLSAEARKHLWAKDFTRWKAEFEKGSQAQDSLKRERRLLHDQVILQPVEPEDYKAEVATGEEIDLVSYNTIPGQTYHFYYQVIYPGPQQAPAVSILDNIRTGRQRRIRSVVIRVEVNRRPDVGSVKTWLLSWNWLDTIAVAFPFRHWLPAPGPQEVWMVRVCFAVDKVSLETF